MDVGIVLLKELRIEVGRAGGIALDQSSVGRLEQIFRLAPDAILGQPFQEGHDLAFRQRAHEAVGRLAVNESDHGRNRLDAHLARNGGVLVDIHLDELHLALGGAHRLFQDRRELLAGAAPGGPEVDQDRLPFRFLDNVFDKGLRRRVLDRTIGGGGLRLLQHLLATPSLLSPSGPQSPVFARLNGKNAAECNRGLQPDLAWCAGLEAASWAETGSIRGGWPVASRNLTSPSREIVVVPVFDSG